MSVVQGKKNVVFGRLKVRKVGNSLGFVLNRDVLNTMKVEEHDELVISQLEDGTFHLSQYDDETMAQLDAGRKAAKRFRNALRALSK